MILNLPLAALIGFFALVLDINFELGSLDIVVIHKDRLLMPKVLVHLLGSHLGLQLLSDLLYVLLLLEHLEQHCLLGFLGSKGGLTAHGIPPLLLRGYLLASFLLHLLL